MRTLLLSLVAMIAISVNAQTTKKVRQTAPRKQTVEQRVIGKHMLSLQWISWDYFGTCTIKRNSAGELECKGEQLSRENNDYLRLDGTIEIVDAKHLRFTGTIVSSIYHINNGEECLREGTFDFVSTEGRRYWRLQQMKNPCDGCTDYVDIYFKR